MPRESSNPTSPAVAAAPVAGRGQAHRPVRLVDAGQRRALPSALPRGPLAAARRLAPAVYLLPALALYATLVLWPLLRLALLSLQEWDGLGPARWVGFANYGALWSDPGFPAELRHSLLWLAVTLVAPTLLGLGLAVLLRLVAARGRAVLRALLLLPLLLPTVLIAVAWRLLYNPLSGPLTGLLETLHVDAARGDWLGDPSLALPAVLVPACWASFGLSMLLCEAALAGVPQEIVAAAALDGAGAWARFRHVTLPALRGALAPALLVTALCATPSYDLVLLLTNGGPGYATTTLSLDSYGRAFGGGQVGAAAALGCLQALVGLGLAVAAIFSARRQERADAGGEAGGASLPASHSRHARRAASLALILAAALVLFPLAWLVVLALRPAPGVGLVATVSGNLAAVWDQGFGGAIQTSLEVAVGVVLVTLALSLPAAFALATTRRRPVRAAAALLLALGLFQPASVLIIPLFYELQGLGLLQGPGPVDYLALLLVQAARTLPAAVLLLWLGMRALPGGVLEAAALDGAPRQVLRYVALPLTLPLAAVVGVWAFLSSWNDYLVPTVVVQDDALQTVPPALAHFIGRFDTQYGLLASGALLALAPLLVLYGGLFGLMGRGLRTLRPRGAGP